MSREMSISFWSLKFKTRKNYLLHYSQKKLSLSFILELFSNMLNFGAAVCELITTIETVEKTKYFLKSFCDEIWLIFLI